MNFFLLMEAVIHIVFELVWGKFAVHWVNINCDHS